MILTVDPERVTGILREIAVEEIMPRFKKLVKSDIVHKGDRGDFATTADLEAERSLTSRLTALLPTSIAVGEETTGKRPELLDAIKGERPVWIIDPIDGTHNFVDGIAHFCVIVALAQGGTTYAAWIHDPVTDTTVAAERGSGAWEEGRRLAAAAPSPLDGMRGAIYARAGRPGVSPRIDEMKRRFKRAIQDRCAGHEYLALARGESHFAMFSLLLPWDHAGGAFIHQEAGGYNACWDGTAYAPTRFTGGLLLAPDRAGWEELAALLLTKD